MTPKAWAEKLAAGDRASLARAITLAESTRAEDRAFAEAILAALPPAHSFIRIGITGAGGAGKSTLIERLGLWLLERGHKVACLAIDPTSPVGGGSILGDKTRMTKLSRAENAFIRPSPSGKWGASVGAATGMAIALTEAAGYDVILIETVGAGQSETAIVDLADFIMLLTLPGGGDSLQGIKRGIGEAADLVIAAQADGAKADAARQTASAYRDALAILGGGVRGEWKPRAMPFSALAGGDDPLRLWEVVEEKRALMQRRGGWDTGRALRRVRWMRRLLTLYLLEAAGEDEFMRAEEEAVRLGERLPERAAEAIAAHLIRDKKS